MLKALALALSFFSMAAMATDKVSVSNIQVKDAGGYLAVEGLARNNTDTTLNNVFVKFKLYNSAGQLVNNTVAHGQDIAPGETWKFSAPAPGNFQKAQLSGVTVY